MPDRPRPQEPDAEKAVLGTILFSPEVLADVRSVLPSLEMFYDLDRRRIYAAICKVSDRRETPDAVTVNQELGGDAMAALLDLRKNESAIAANGVVYARLVREASVRREIIAGCERLELRAYSKAEDVAGLLTAADALSADLSVSDSEFVRWDEAVGQAIEDIEWANANPGQIRGLRIGITRLDEMLNGLEGGNYYLIGARPSEGKTAVALAFSRHIARNASWESPVLFISREMPSKALAMRGIAQAAGVNMQAIRLGNMSDRAWDKVQAAIELEGQYPILCDEKSTTACDVRSAARMAARKYGIGLLVVDYLQRLDPPRGQKFGSRDEAVTKTSRMMKDIALDLNIPVLVLAQLNREVEKRPDKRPQLGDLRESGSIEQDADVAMFLYRPGFQALKVAKDEAEREAARKDHRLEILVRKQRNGEVGTVHTYLDPATQTVGETQREAI